MYLCKITINKNKNEKKNLAVVVVFVFANDYSQKEGSFRVGLDLGYTVTSNRGGFCFL
jgi:hypothetical protein